MNWLFDLYKINPTAQAIALIALVCAAGMALGSIKVQGIGLGTAAVLFAGIPVGYLSHPIEHHTLEFVKELGLVLFVFCIGLQLGPGFFASLRRMGLRLNVLAGVIVISGALLATGIGRLLGMDSAAVLGLFSGATTNTPSLGAAQQTLSEMPGVSAERAALPALAYAVSYPGAIVGIIATVLLLKRFFHLDPIREAEAFAREQRNSADRLERRTLVIDNPNLDGVTVDSARELTVSGVVISRIQRRGERDVHIAGGDSVLHVGDRILCVGVKRSLDQCQMIVGHAGDEDLAEAPGAITHRRVAATRKDVLGQSLHQLGLEKKFGVTVTRVTRAGLEMIAVPNLAIQFGDVLQVVGDEKSIRKAAAHLGDSLKALNETHFVPLFAGILMGILVGTLPLHVPGMPQPLRLGLAGGPLIVAILLGRLGRIGPLVWHMPLSANLAFREFGIALFFAGVGLMAGPQFFATVFSADGLRWLAGGFGVTVLPILAIGAFALAVWKMNFAAVSGLIAGSMTDPPALAFSTSICGNESPTVAYAAVYPLTTMLRILAAQVLAVMLCG